MIEKIKRNILLSLLITALVIVAIGILSDVDSILAAFKNFDWILLPILILLSLCNYFFRYLKWEYYLRILKINVSRPDSIKIFLSGLVMSVSPAKMGEVIKSLLLKDIYNEPITKTAPIVFAERLTDFFALTIIAAIGALLFHYSKVLIVIVLIVLLLIVFIISNEKLFSVILNILKKIPFIEKQSNNILRSYESSFLLIKTSHLIPMIMNSILSWSFECFGFYLILINFDLDISLQYPFFVYAFSIIAGAVSMLPGGLGVTEGSLSFLLINFGIKSEVAFASTIIVRSVTLWFATLIGAVTLFLYTKQLKKMSE